MSKKLEEKHRMMGIVSDGALEDENLGWNAKGVWIVGKMLGKSKYKELLDSSNAHEQDLQRSLEELIRNGYCRIEKTMPQRYEFLDYPQEECKDKTFRFH